MLCLLYYFEKSLFRNRSFSPQFAQVCFRGELSFLEELYCNRTLAFLSVDQPAHLLEVRMIVATSAWILCLPLQALCNKR